jgi:predicted transcriptional regulator
MPAKTRMIEIDEATAAALQVRAAERGLSVSQLVTELARSETASLLQDAEETAELDRRWAAAETGSTVPHSDVVRWLETWGTPDFRPWRGR